MDAYTNHTSPPLAGSRMARVAIGANTKTFWTDTTGSFQAVTLPAGTECKAVLISVHDGDDTIYDIDTGNAGFLFSSEADGTGWSRVRPDGFGMSIGKAETHDGGVLGYVKAATGKKIAVLALY